MGIPRLRLRQPPRQRRDGGVSRGDFRARRVAFRLQRRAPPFPVFENAFLFSRQGFSRRRSPVRAFVRTEPSFEAFESRAKRTPFVGALYVALYVVALYVARTRFLRAARRRQRPGSGEARRVRRRVRAPGAPPSRPERVDRECRALTELLSWYRNDLERVACGTRTRPGPGRRRRRRLARDARSRRERGRFLRRCAPRAHVRAAPRRPQRLRSPRWYRLHAWYRITDVRFAVFNIHVRPAPAPDRSAAVRVGAGGASRRETRRRAAPKKRVFSSSRALGLRRRRRRARPVAVERGAEAPRFSVPVARFSSSSGVTVTRPRRLLLRVAHGAEQRRALGVGGRPRRRRLRFRKRAHEYRWRVFLVPIGSRRDASSGREPVRPPRPWAPAGARRARTRRVGGRRGTLRGGVPGGRTRSQRERPHPLFRRVVPLGAAFPKDGCRGDAVRGSSDATRRGTSPRSARRRVRLRPWKRLDAGCVPERVSVACHRAAREHVWRLGSFVGRDVRFSRAAAHPLRVFWQRSFGQNPAIQFRARKSRDRRIGRSETRPVGGHTRRTGPRVRLGTSSCPKSGLRRKILLRGSTLRLTRSPAPARGDHAPWARRAARASQSRRSPRRPGQRASPPARRTPPRWRARRKNVP